MSKKQIGIRLEEETIAKLEDLAKNNNTSLANFCRNLIVERLDDKIIKFNLLKQPYKKLNEYCLDSGQKINDLVPIIISEWLKTLIPEFFNKKVLVELNIMKFLLSAISESDYDRLAEIFFENILLINSSILNKYYFNGGSRSAIEQVLHVTQNSFVDIKIYKKGDLNIFFGKHDIGKPFSICFLKTMHLVLDKLENASIIDSSISEEFIEFIWKKNNAD